MLPKQNRLSKNNELMLVLRYGRPARSRFLGIKVLPTKYPESRIAFIVSNKVSKKAVERNTLKRKMRAIAFSLLREMHRSHDMVITAQPSLLGKDNEFIAMEIVNKLKKLRIIS